MDHLEKIIKLVDEGAERAIEIRRDIHQHPELAFHDECACETGTGCDGNSI